jgi:TonB family protein
VKKLLPILLFTVISFIANAQQSGKADTSHIFYAVEREPEYAGGLDRFAQYLQQNIVYPPGALKSRTQGKVFVTFVVEKDGTLSNVAIVRGVSEDIDAEAVRVIKNSPKWKPGIQNGLVVRAQFTMPLSFRLPPQDMTSKFPQPDSANLNQRIADKVFAAVEKEPEFPGGIESFYNYIQKNIRYPEHAKKNNYQGKVFITFVVQKDGTLDDIKVVRSSGYDDLDAEAVRLIQNSPKWNPGLQNKRPVRVQYTMPISFSQDNH